MERNIPEGELVLVVTNHEKVDVLTLGVSNGLEKQKRRLVGGKSHEYIYISNALRLVSGKVVVRGEEYPALNLIGSNPSFNLDSKTTRILVGKEEVLSYFGEKADFVMHTNWILSLAKPYQENMPKVKTTAYLDISSNT